MKHLWIRGRAKAVLGYIRLLDDTEPDDVCDDQLLLYCWARRN